MTTQPTTYVRPCVDVVEHLGVNGTIPINHVQNAIVRLKIKRAMITTSNPSTAEADRCVRS